MADEPGTWARRAGMMALPLGIITGLLVVLRAAPILIGSDRFDGFDALWIIIFSVLAGTQVKAGLDYRRSVERRP